RDDVSRGRRCASDRIILSADDFYAAESIADRIVTRVLGCRTGDVGADIVALEHISAGVGEDEHSATSTAVATDNVSCSGCGAADGRVGRSIDLDPLEGV